MPSTISSARQRKKAIQFGLSIGIAVLAWMGLIFSKVYTYELKSRIEVHTGEAVYIDKSADSRIQLRSSGWKFALLKLIPHTKVIINDPAKKGFVCSALHLKEISKQLKGVQVIGVLPDTIFMPAAVLSNRKVPVLLETSLRFNNQFWLSGPLLISPDSVLVSGSPKDIEKIKQVLSKPLRLSGLNASLTKSVALQELKGIVLSPDTVRVMIPVVPYTENYAFVPLIVHNDLDNYEVQTLPKKVKVAYKVSLSRYDSVQPTAFKASVDLNDWIDKKQSRLTVHLDEASSQVQVLGVYPSKVDFIVRKQ